MNNPEHLLPSNPNQTVVLVVDDEVSVRNVVRIALEREGYFTLVAHDGEEALEMSRRYPGTIHALVTDVKMPVMDGLVLREKILLERPAIQVLLMSGAHSSNSTVPFIQKPFDVDVLRKCVQQLLSSSGIV